MGTLKPLTLSTRTHILKAPLLHSPFNPQLQTLFNRRITLSFTISCKLRTSQDVKKKNDNVSKKIVFSDSSPPPLKNVEVSGKVESKSGVIRLVKRLPRRVLAALFNLPSAIGEMAAIAALMALMLPLFLLYSLLIAAYRFLVVIF